MPGIILGSVSSAPSTPPVTNGELWMWGQDQMGQNIDRKTGVLDRNQSTNTSSPVQVGTLNTWQSVAVTRCPVYNYFKYVPADFNLPNQVAGAINTSGQLFTWGGFVFTFTPVFPPITVYYYNSLNLGHGNGRIPRSSPIQVGTGTNWSKVSVGGQTTAAIKTDGTLWTWGWNAYGQLGIAVDTNTRTSPVQVGTGTNWSQVSVGRLHVLALKTDGTLWSWGNNDSGELGHNDVNDKSSPVQVGAGTNWSKISAGYSHSLAVKTDGTLWAWGDNIRGQIGDNSVINRSSPVQIGTGTNWSSVSAENNSFAIKTDGTLWGWGSNNYGQLGDNTVIARSSPVQVGTGTDWSKVSTGGTFTLAIKTNGTMWSWGQNNLGQLGHNNLTYRSSPVQIGALTTWIDIDSSRYFCAAIKS